MARLVCDYLVLSFLISSLFLPSLSLVQFCFVLSLLFSLVLSYLTRLVCSLPVLSVLYRLLSCLVSTRLRSSHPVLFVSSRLVFVSMCVYLGFDDAAVEAVVLLLVQQTELQRSQRGCQKRNTGTTLEKMDPEHLFASCTINQFPSKTDQH